ncbi:site-specific integrase [Nocardia noduli]|uniref:site-specific integrase n=1 Tax=Nocardia noduli TaxID=2815722 RepID=UPI0020B2745C|nr:site-specific integrase [Nocardia noduli]
MFKEICRDVRTAQVPKWGRVVEVSGPVLFTVIDETGEPVAPIRRFLIDVIAQGNSRNSVRRSGRAKAHHNPLDPTVPKVGSATTRNCPNQPREISDPQWQALFAALRSNRDRAVLTVAVSTAARAQEILGMRMADLDWGEQLVQVIRKGTQASQWLPASGEAFVWLRLYLAELDAPLDLRQQLWRTLRRGIPVPAD